MMRWMRTWGTGAWGAGLPAPQGRQRRLLAEPDRGGILLPAMYDSDEEKALVIALFEHYNHGGLTPAVDAEFDASGARPAASRSCASATT